MEQRDAKGAPPRREPTGDKLLDWLAGQRKPYTRSDGVLHVDEAVVRELYWNWQRAQTRYREAEAALVACHPVKMPDGTVPAYDPNDHRATARLVQDAFMGYAGRVDVLEADLRRERGISYTQTSRAAVWHQVTLATWRGLRRYGRHAWWCRPRAWWQSLVGRRRVPCTCGLLVVLLSQDPDDWEAAVGTLGGHAGGADEAAVQARRAFEALAGAFARKGKEGQGDG